MPIIILPGRELALALALIIIEMPARYNRRHPISPRLCLRLILKRPGADARMWALRACALEMRWRDHCLPAARPRHPHFLMAYRCPIWRRAASAAIDEVTKWHGDLHHAQPSVGRKHHRPEILVDAYFAMEKRRLLSVLTARMASLLLIAAESSVLLYIYLLGAGQP